MNPEYLSLIETRKLLESLASKDDSLAKACLKNFPDEPRAATLIGHSEEIKAGVWKRSKGNPVEYHPEKGGWVFWEVDWVNWTGPFATMDECHKALDEYCKTLG